LHGTPGGLIDEKNNVKQTPLDTRELKQKYETHGRGFQQITSAELMLRS